MRNNGDDYHNRAIKHGLTAAERQKLVERYFERAQLRQAEEDLALVQAVKLGQALQRLKGG